MHSLKWRVSDLEKLSQPKERGRVVTLICGNQTDDEIDAFLIENGIIGSELDHMILMQIVDVAPGGGPMVAEDQPLRFDGNR